MIHPGKSKILNRYHLALFQLMEIVTDFIDRDNVTFSVCSPQECNPLCRSILNDPAGRARCDGCTAGVLELCRKDRKARRYHCHAGMVDMVVPLFVGDYYLGSLTSGQVRTEPPSERNFQEFLAGHPYLKLPEAQLRQDFFGCKVCTETQLDALMEMLQLIGTYVIETESRLDFLETVNEKKPIQAARLYMEQNCGSCLTVAEIARRVSLSESHFCHLFKAETGISPIQYLNRARIGRAAERLRSSSDSITSIAFEAGFQSLTHFNRIFLKLMGETPRNYRKKQKK